MRISEILRSLVDLIDAAESQQETQPEPPANQGVFVPPLQAKLELLKKSVNVDSVYDQDGPDEQLTGYGQDNQDLEQLKQRAGIPSAIIHLASDDEPLDC